MDLYRTLRVSIYLTVASGAFALSVAEQNLFYLFAVLAFGGLAYATVDSGRVRPVRMEYAAAMTLALLLYTLVPLREEDGWNKHFAAAIAHFLCAFQVLLFFTAYRGPVLLTFCGSSLIVVVTSGVMQPDVSLVIRMVCYVGLTAWTLFIHSLWRSRERFAHATNSASAQSGGLSERAFWQGLSMMLGMSLVCLVLGFFLFYFAPRVNDSISAFINDWFRKPTQKSPAAGRDSTGLHGGVGVGGGGAGDDLSKGWSEGVEYCRWGPIADDKKVAYTVTIPTLSRDMADKDGRVYLRGLAMSEHKSLTGSWLPDPGDRTEYKVVQDNNPIELPPDPAAAPTGTREMTMLVQQKETISSVIFSIGTPLRVKGPLVKRVLVDREGALWKGDKAADRYEVVARMPVFPDQVRMDARAEHPTYNSYYTFGNHGLAGKDVEEIQSLAKSIVLKAHAETSMEKIRAIQKYLQDPKFQYSLDLKNFSVKQFLLDDDKHRGHCGLYATAFVLLCRFNKIPARMASGFCAELTKEQLKGGEQRIDFLNSDSHAWGEVYFKDIGWVPFDATPAGAGTQVVATTDPAAAPSVEPAVPPMALPSQSGVFERAWTSVMGYDSREQNGMYAYIGDTVINGLGGTRDIFSGRSTGGWFIAVFAWAAVVVMLFWLLHIFLRRGRRRSGGGMSGTGRSRAAVAFYNDLLQVLSRRGFVRRPGQTPREFAEFVVRRGGETFQPVMVVTQVFEQVRYGGVEVSQDDFNQLQTALDKLRELTFIATAPAARN